MAKMATQDLSSFMCIVLMTIGFMVTILVINVLIVTSNPSNVEITSVVKFAYSSEEKQQIEGAGVPFFGNKSKEPNYIDVHRDHLVLYPGEQVVSPSDLEKQGNPLEKLLNRVEGNAEEEYVVLLLRPYSAILGRRLKKIVKSRGIDVGQELYEAERKVDYTPAENTPAEAARKAALAQHAGEAVNPPPASPPAPSPAPSAQPAAAPADQTSAPVQAQPSTPAPESK